jgi:hypothetical protein
MVRRTPPPPSTHTHTRLTSFNTHARTHMHRHLRGQSGRRSTLGTAVRLFFQPATRKRAARLRQQCTLHSGSTLPALGALKLPIPSSFFAQQTVYSSIQYTWQCRAFLGAPPGRAAPSFLSASAPARQRASQIAWALLPPRANAGQALPCSCYLPLQDGPTAAELQSHTGTAIQKKRYKAPAGRQQARASRAASSGRAAGLLAPSRAPDEHKGAQD